MSISGRDVDPGLEDDLLDDGLEMDVYESFRAAAEPSRAALDRLAAAGADDEYYDDDYVNQEDPYLRDLLGSDADN